MSYPGGPQQPQPPTPTMPPMVDIVPVTEIPCHHCGSVCFRGRVERLGVVLHTFGWYMMFIGYLVLTVGVVGSLVETILRAWTSYQPDPFLDLHLLCYLLGLIVLGHLLAMERQVWICAACGSLFDRSERVEAIHADRQAKKQAEE